MAARLENCFTYRIWPTCFPRCLRSRLTQSDARPLNDPNMANSEAAGAPNDEAAAILRTALATKLEEGSVSSVRRAQNLKRERVPPAARERLIELGFGKVGERSGRNMRSWADSVMHPDRV